MANLTSAYFSTIRNIKHIMGRNHIEFISLYLVNNPLENTCNRDGDGTISTKELVTRVLHDAHCSTTKIRLTMQVYL